MLVHGLVSLLSFATVNCIAIHATIPNKGVRTIETPEVFETNGMILHKLDLSSIGGGAYVTSLGDQFEYAKMGTTQDSRVINIVPNMANANLKHSNLGGQGPDTGTPNLRFSNFSSVNGHQVDLVVTEEFGNYKAHDNSLNGLNSKHGLRTAFGRINLACGSRSSLRFTLMDADALTGMEPASFFFSASYLGNARQRNPEEISFDNPRPTSFWVTEKTELEVTDAGNGYWQVPIHAASESTLANDFGFDAMTELKMDRFITAYYAGTSEFSVKVGSEKDVDCEYSSGRDLMFTFSPKDPLPKKDEANKAPACQRLDLMKSFVFKTVIGGEERLVYSKVAFHDGKNVDLEVLRVSGNKLADNPELDAKKEGFGRINGPCGSSVELQFRLVNTDNRSPIVVPNFCLSFSDIDAGVAGRCRESVTVRGFDAVYLADKTQLMTWVTAEGATSFSALAHGQGSDNPSVPWNMSDTQSARTVGLSFLNTSEILATLAWGPGGYGGRNILFSGSN